VLPRVDAHLLSLQGKVGRSHPRLWLGGLSHAHLLLAAPVGGRAECVRTCLVLVCMLYLFPLLLNPTAGQIRLTQFPFKILYVIKMLGAAAGALLRSACAECLCGLVRGLVRTKQGPILHKGGLQRAALSGGCSTIRCLLTVDVSPCVGRARHKPFTPSFPLGGGCA
jgi:hypothetical protein